MARTADARVPGLDRALSLVVHEHDDRHVSERIVNEGVWEPFETELVRRLLTPDCLFVDCGANIGWYSVVAAALGARVIAFEPMPANAAIARANVERNGLAHRVELHVCGLGSAPARAILELSASNQGDHRLCAMPSGRKATIEIDVITLDAALARRRPDVLKLDTQGSEVAILRGGRSAWGPITGSVDPAIVLEFWPYGLLHCGATAAQLIGMLAELVDISHRCFEIEEWRSALTPLTIDELRAMAATGGYSPASKGFTNLLLVPFDRVAVVDDLVRR